MKDLLDRRRPADGLRPPRLPRRGPPRPRAPPLGRGARRPPVRGRPGPRAGGAQGAARAASRPARSRPTSSSGRPSSSTSPRSPAHMFTSMFTCARTAGWCAHILEQKNTGRLVRPSARYIGPDPRKPDEVEGWDTIDATTRRRSTVEQPTRAASSTARGAARMSMTIPADLLPADGRFGCGPVQGAARGAAGAGHRRCRAHGHVAPAGAGQGAGPPGARGPAHPVRPARRLRGGARQRRVDGVLGRGALRPDPEPQRPRRLRRVLGQVRLRGGRGAVPRGPGDRQGRSGLPGPPARPGRRRRLRVGAQRDLDRGHGRRSAAPRAATTASC